MHRFFVRPEDIADHRVCLDLDQSRHIDKVLRLAPGDKILFFDGLGQEYELLLGGLQNGQVWGEIIQTLQRDTEPPFILSLVQGIAKGDKMDLIIQKAVELGVAAIYPVFSQYAVVKLEKERAGKKQARWQTIAREACKQCRRNRVPTVHPPRTFQSMLEMMAGKPAIMLYENEAHLGLKELLAEKRRTLLSGQELFLIVGPEGGFAPAEVTAARAQGIMVAGLGPRILRTETAALVATSIILYELADLGQGRRN